MSFWGSLFGGSNPTLNKDMNNFGQIGGFATGLGENNLSQASQFMSSILSGDSSKISKTLAPQISTIQQQKQQGMNQTAEFGNRSGGNNSSNQMAGDKAKASINDMISSLMGSSASGLASTGSSLLSQGQSAYGAQLAASQQQIQNWRQSILGSGVIDAAQTGLNFAEGKAGL